MSPSPLDHLAHLVRAFGEDTFSFAEARQEAGLSSPSTLAAMQRAGYVRRLTPRRQGGSDPSLTLWQITPRGIAKAAMEYLTLPLTPQERRDLFDLLNFEKVDTRDPRAIADWLLYQVGILPEGKPCK